MITIESLRALKGAPVSVLLCLAFSGHPVGENFISSMTGYSVNTIRNACKYLVTIQLIRRNGRYEGYVLSDGVFQLALPSADFVESQNLPLDPLITTTTTFNKKQKSFLLSEAAEVKTGALKIDAPDICRASKIDAPDDGHPRDITTSDARLTILYDYGIMEPTASKIISKSWVTENYIKSHIEKASKDRIDIGLLIHRMLSHDPVLTPFDSQSPRSYRESWLGIK